MSHSHDLSHRQEREKLKAEHAGPTPGPTLASRNPSWLIIVAVLFVGIAAIGCVSTVTLLRRARAAEGAGAFARYWWAAAVVYAVVAVLGVAPGIAGSIGVTPLQAEATLLVLLVALAHALVWEFMTHEGHAEPT